MDTTHPNKYKNENQNTIHIQETNANQVSWRRYCLWDNLTSNHSINVMNAFANHNGRLIASAIPRPPYQPKYGPIEYKICNLIIECKINSCFDWDDRSLEQAVYEAAGRISGFDQIFEHCGYSRDGNNSFYSNLIKLLYICLIFLVNIGIHLLLGYEK